MTDYDLENREPEQTVEIDLTIEVERYEIESDEHDWIEARPVVMRSDMAQYYTVSTDLEQAVRKWFPAAIQYDMRSELEGLLE